MEKINLSALIILSLLSLSAAYSASQTIPVASQYVNNISCTVLFLVEVVAILIAALVLLFMSLKYKASGGDTESRHMAREGMTGAITGLIILALAVPVVNMQIGDFLGSVSCKIIPSPGELMDAFSLQYLSTGNANKDSSNDTSSEQLPDLVLEKAYLSNSFESLSIGDSIEINVSYKGNGDPICNYEIVSYLETERELDTIPVCKLTRDSEKTDYCVSEGKPSMELACNISDPFLLKEQITSFLSDGKQHYFVVSVDPSGMIVESDKKDNTLRMPLADFLKTS